MSIEIYSCHYNYVEKFQKLVMGWKTFVIAESHLLWFWLIVLLFLLMSKVRIEKELDAVPTENEIQVVDILVKNKIPKEHILFLKPNRQKGSRTPDIIIDHTLKWEIKSVEKDGKYTLDHAERAGLKQSENLVFDLRKLSKPVAKKYEARLQKDYQRINKWTRLIIIDKKQKCLTFNK